MDKDGNEIDSGSSGVINCAKISCTEKGGSGKIRYVYYIRTDLSGSNQSIDSLIKFVEKNTFGTFIKSASYALHDRRFTKFKKFLLNGSKFILQDDTGIPFADYSSADWTKYAFGTYTEPTLAMFKGYKLPAMTNFFRDNTKNKIPFKIGYGFNQCRPNLLLSVKKSVGSRKNYEIISEVQKLKAEDSADCKDCNNGE
jgi:hypothetical protein